MHPPPDAAVNEGVSALFGVAHQSWDPISDLPKRTNTASNPILARLISDIPPARRVRAALQRELPAGAAGEQWAIVRLMWKELLKA